jgi:hypothetical protein
LPWRDACIFICFFALIVALQWASGAYHAEFGGYPDEPAHYVTSLMVRDFLAGMNWWHPLDYAQRYYHCYPKVAFGHWPPLLYVLQAGWMLLFSASRTSIRLEIAFTTAVLAYSVFCEGRRWFSGYAAPVLAGLLTICIPLVQIYADEEMAESLLTLMCFWAAIWFARYLESEKWQDNLRFGIFFALAVLTKGNGWLLAGIVPIALVLTRKFRLMRNWQFWVAPLLVAATCLPWQLLTLGLAEQGWTAGTEPSIQYTVSALSQFAVILMQTAGVALGCLALLGTAVTVLAPALRGYCSSSPAAMLGLVLCTWMFHAIVPAGVEDRKMLIAVPAWVLFIFAGGYWLADQLPLRGVLALRRNWLVAGIGAIVFGLSGFAIPHQWHYGYAEAAQFITSSPQLRNDTILTSDDSTGEGLLISEIAMRESRPGTVIVRATKALADMNWNASRYQSLYSTPKQVSDAIEKLHVDLVVFGTFGGSHSLRHNELLGEALRDTHKFQLIASFNGAAWDGPGKILIYKVRHLEA